MNNSFETAITEYINIVEIALKNYLAPKDNYQANIYNAMQYSVFAGGKRLRAVLVLAGCEIVGGNIKNALPFACAIECIHTYSLIHDDLPAMDNDDTRRGIPTNHIKFGDAMAILAGDALLNKAFELMLEDSENELDPKQALKALSVIARAAGAEGMIGGQVVDIEAEGKEITLDRLEYMHAHKTGALICAAVISGAIAGGASDKQISALKEYASCLGLAFQIRDDILDIEGDGTKLGKPIGSDDKNKKSTFVSICGMQEAKKRLEQLTEAAKSALDIFGEKGLFLKELANFLHNRDH